MLRITASWRWTRLLHWPGPPMERIFWVQELRITLLVMVPTFGNLPRNILTARPTVLRVILPRTSRHLPIAIIRPTEALRRVRGICPRSRSCQTCMPLRGPSSRSLRRMAVWRFWFTIGLLPRTRARTVTRGMWISLLSSRISATRLTETLYAASEGRWLRIPTPEPIPERARSPG